MFLRILIFFKKIKNSFLTPRLRFFYKNYDKKFIRKKKNFFQKLASNIWFMPYDISQKYWHNINKKSNHYYKNYIEIDNDANILLDEVVAHAESKNIKVLDLGCNAGRHLNYLLGKGFTNLYGVDICKIAVKDSKKIFPKLKKIKTIKCISFENFLSNTKDSFFEIIYSHGATIELVKPTFPLIAELSRTVRGYLILLFQEDGHSYPRFWRYEFAKNGLKLIKARKFNNDQILLVYKKQPTIF